MEQNVKAVVTEEVRELMAAPSCCATAKAACQAWLDALDTPEESAKTQALVTELEADIMPVDGLLAFANSEQGTQVFGAELAKQIADHAAQLKAQGAPYCDCPACAAVAKILTHKDALLA